VSCVKTEGTKQTICTMEAVFGGAVAIEGVCLVHTKGLLHHA